MSSLVVILDACVLVPASLRDTLLHTTAGGLYKVVLTEEILEELRHSLTDDINISAHKTQYFLQTLRKYFHFAFITQHTPLIAAMPVNFKDRHVLAAAVASRAQVIVTQNLRDFPAELLAPFEVTAQSPDDFLTNLFFLEPERMATIVMTQANELRNPPRSVDEVLGTLAQHTPNFVKLVRKKIDSYQ